MSDSAPKVPAKRKAPPHAWKPGQSGNPTGGVQMPADVKQAKLLDKIAFARTLHELMHKDSGTIERILLNPDSPAIEKIIAKIIQRAIEGGDHWRLDFLLNRLIGKVKDEVEHSGSLTLAQLLSKSREIPDDER